MKRLSSVFFFFAYIFTLVSCVTVREVRYMQPNENLVINEEGLIPYNIPVYRLNKSDMLTLNIVTTPKGDAAQFYSALNASGQNGTANPATQSSNIAVQGNTGSGSGNVNIFFNGLKVNSTGDINVFGIGFIKAEGRTIEEITADIQQKVNENFLEGKSEVRLNLDGINYYIIGDVETTGITGEKVAYKNNLNVSQAIAMNGGLNRTIDRTDVRIHRKYPEGIKVAHIDLTREDVMNSEYYWVQPGDEIYLNTRAKNLNGFGKDPVQTLTAGVSVLTTLMSIYLILKTL